MRAATILLVVAVLAVLTTGVAGADGCTVGLPADIAGAYPGHNLTAGVVQEDGCVQIFHPERRVTTASIVKVEILAGVLLRAQREGRGLSARERSLAEPMITRSANAEATQLFGSLGGSAALEDVDHALGMPDTRHPGSTWGLTSTSASDQLHLLGQLMPGGPGPLSAVGRADARALLTSVVPSQRWGASAGVPAGWVVAQKNGFASSRCCAWRINTIGWIERPDGGRWSVVVLSDGWRTAEEGVVAVHDVAGRLNRAVLGAPVGSLDLVEVDGGGVRVGGWAGDPNADGPTSVELRVDGATVAAVAADARRDDVAAAHPALGPDHGFMTTISVGSGDHRVCAVAINRGHAAPDTEVGCRTFAVR